MEKKKLLLHTCCAPCTGHVYEVLSAEYCVTAFFFNPNISPRTEYNKRLDELKKYALTRNFPLEEGPYDIRGWTARVRPLRFHGERSVRCRECFRFRLGETFKKAEQLRMEAVATSLSISPHKDAAVINALGRELQDQYGIEFHAADFKKQDGYKKSVEISRLHGFYRQDYCGCIYSKMERDRESAWSARVRAFRSSFQ